MAKNNISLKMKHTDNLDSCSDNIYVKHVYPNYGFSIIVSIKSKQTSRRKIWIKSKEKGIAKKLCNKGGCLHLQMY